MNCDEVNRCDGPCRRNDTLDEQRVPVKDRLEYPMRDRLNLYVAADKVISELVSNRLG